MINMILNNKPISVLHDSTILEAANENNIDIPHLCYLQGVHEAGACGLCLVEIEGESKLQASCMVKVTEGMVVKTDTPEVRKQRKNNYKLLLSNHKVDCPSCHSNKNCELQDLGIRLGVTQESFTGVISDGKTDSSTALTYDPAKCIHCRRCITVCNEIQDVGILPAMDLPLGSVNCVFCGQCTVVCPVGAIKETDITEDVWNVINDNSKYTVVQVSTPVSLAIGEEFGDDPGTSLTGELISCLKELGFNTVFDTNFAADRKSVV